MKTFEIGDKFELDITQEDIDISVEECRLYKETSCHCPIATAMKRYCGAEHAEFGFTHGRVDADYIYYFSTKSRIRLDFDTNYVNNPELIKPERIIVKIDEKRHYE